MPVTVVLPNKPKPCPTVSPEVSGLNLLQKACPKYVKGANEVVLEGTWKEVAASDNVMATSDSFLRGAIEAYASHMHLVLRPDEVWFAILTQMNFYMAENAESIRHLFVSHKGQKSIYIEGMMTPRQLLGRFSNAIQECIKTPWLKDWIMPNFSTTMPGDRMTANVLMMGLMQKYFKYFMCQTCGIPSVTLLGEMEDWESLLEKLDRMPDFGLEPAEYAAMLRPVLENFVSTFVDPTGENTVTFWNKMFRARQMSMCGGPEVEIDGWLLNFVQWDTEGKLVRRQEGASDPFHDGFNWASFDILSLPVSYIKVPVVLIDGRGPPWPLNAVAGGMTKRISAGAPRGYYKALGRPVPREDPDLPSYARTSPPEPGKERKKKKEQTTTHGSGGCVKTILNLFSASRPKAQPLELQMKNQKPAPATSKSSRGVKERESGVHKKGSSFPRSDDKAAHSNGPRLDSETLNSPIWNDLLHTVEQEASEAKKDEPAVVPNGAVEDELNDAAPSVHFDAALMMSVEDEMPTQSGSPWQATKVEIIQLDGSEGREHATLQPLSGWMLFGNKDRSEMQTWSVENPDDESGKLERLLLTSCLNDRVKKQHWAAL